ncbi:MAG: THUMP domain-containing protein [Pseudomonadota bacterium]
MNPHMAFFATAPKGIEPLLAEELRNLEAKEVVQTRAGVSFRGALATAYRACLWSRLASRILLPLTSFHASSPAELYDGARSLPWKDHMAVRGTLAVDCNTSQSTITHSHFAAMKIKDAIVDQFRDECGVRPSVDISQPDMRINAYIHRDRATLSLDLSGESLHRRGYRERDVAAPMKENLAAAILLYAKWPSIAQEGGMLVDPMCGSGTIPIEAALLAADIAPGMLRSGFGFLGWRHHHESVWMDLLSEARDRRRKGLEKLPRIVGCDRDPRAVAAAMANVDRIKLAGKLHFERRDVSDLHRLPGIRDAHGLVVVNPPYGERLGGEEDLCGLYSSLGKRLRQDFMYWKAAVFTHSPELGKKIGIRARRIHTLYNGALECKLLHFEIDPQWFMREYRKPAQPAAAGKQPAVLLPPGKLEDWGNK